MGSTGRAGIGEHILKFMWYPFKDIPCFRTIYDNGTVTYLHTPDIVEVAQISFATVDSKGVMRALPQDLTLDDLREVGYLFLLNLFFEIKY